MQFLYYFKRAHTVSAILYVQQTRSNPRSKADSVEHIRLQTVLAQKQRSHWPQSGYSKWHQAFSMTSPCNTFHNVEPTHSLLHTFSTCSLHSIILHEFEAFRLILEPKSKTCQQQAHKPANSRKLARIASGSAKANCIMQPSH